MKGTIVANPFAEIMVLPVDREALYGGLISAGHPIEYARHQADTLPNNDGSLQMLASHREQSAALSQPLLGEVREVASRFTGHSNASLAGQCRMQARDSLDPEYEQFMLSVADRLSQPTLSEIHDVLEPFARVVAAVGEHDPDFPDDGACLRASFDWYDGPNKSRQSLRMRDLRRAAALLAKLSPADGGGE